MSSIYSGIYLKLKSPRTPWEDRLKLARFAWISSQCLLPNKEQVLLDWCTHALTCWHNKKVEFSQDVLEGLWCYLDDVLHSQKLHSFLKQGKTVTLRLNMAQLLLDHLQDCAHDRPRVCVSTVLSVCRGIFSSPVLSSVFTTKYELMVNLLARFCLLASHAIQKPLISTGQMTESDTCSNEPMMEHLQTEPNSSPKSKRNCPSADCFEVLHQILSCYLSVQRQQANPSRVFALVTNQLIQPLVLLRYLLTSQDFTTSQSHLHLRQQLCRDICIKIDSILQLALFPSEHLASYKAELFPSKEDSGKRGSGGTKGPLNPVSAFLSKLTAQGYCEPSLLYPLKSDASSLLFKFFLESYGRGKGESEEEQKMLCFYFLVQLVTMLGLHLNGFSVTPTKAEQQSNQKSPPASSEAPESWILALQALQSLLNQALSADIYNVAADRIRHNEIQLKFYRALAQMLLKEAQPSIPSWYCSLKVLLSLNHLILEPDLDLLLSSAWVDAEDLAAEVQTSRQIVVCSLLQTYTKLRQLPRLFSVLLPVICQSARGDRHPPLLSEGISVSLRTCLLDTPPSQVLEVCSSVLKSIRTWKEQTEAEKMEIDGDHRNQEREDASLKLSCLCQLLHVVLFSLKTLNNSSPVPLVRQSIGFMEEMQQAIKELHHLLSADRTSFKTNVSSGQKSPRKGKKNQKEKLENVLKLRTETYGEQKTQEAVLLLRYTWVEVDTLFHIHCSRYTSVDSFLTAAENETEASSSSPLLAHVNSLVSGAVLPSHLHPSHSCSPMSRLLLKLLVLQQMKKVLLDSSLLCESITAALLNRAAQFIVAKSELEVTADGEQVWDGQIGSVNASIYPVAHWYLVVSNLPLIVPHLSGEDVHHIAHVLVSSLLDRQTEGSKHHPRGSLTFSLISSQLVLSSIFPELASLFSATVRSLTERIIGVLKAGDTPKGCPNFLTVHDREAGDISSENDVTQHVFSLVCITQDILASSKTGEVSVLLKDTQIKELGNLLQILTKLSPDGMSSEDLSSTFLLLLFMFTSTSRQLGQVIMEAPESRGDPVFLGKLLRTLTFLLEGSNFQSVLKLIHGGTLLQTVLSSLLWHSKSIKHQETCSTDWLDVVKTAQDFIRSLVQMIIIRNSSVRLNLDQFGSFLTSKEIAARQMVLSDSNTSMLSVYLLLASLTSFSQTMTSNLGKSKPMDQTLTQILTRTTSLLGPVVESVLKSQTACDAAFQSASILSQAFLVEVVTVMLNCELTSLSVETESKQNGPQLSHMTLYQVICQQILREISSASRPMDFLVCSLHFLSGFYKALEKMRAEEEMKAMYVQMLQTLHKLLKAPWLSAADVEELEPAVQELLCHLVEKCTTRQFDVLLLMIREGLDVGKLRAGNCKVVLSAVITIKLLLNCQLPESCSKALWLVAPQIISAVVFLVGSSSQDVSLTLSVTLPMVTLMTSLLRRGEGLISNPHHVTLVLGALQVLPLHPLTPPVYHSVFLAVHEALFAIIQCHPQVISKAASSFLNVFYRLVASIMQEGRQKGDSVADSDAYLQCSLLIERMFSHIAAAAESFTALPAFMVAQYVTELQKVTLRPDIKPHLTEGVYCILDLCREQDIKFLKARLSPGVREVFNELYDTYTHYHKPQRQGEDKYTV